MSLSAKVYANSDNTVFYNTQLQLVIEIHDSGEWNPHKLNQYKKGDFLGVTTGNIKQIGDENVIEILHSYDHQYKVGFISKWRPRTVNLYVPESLVTTQAPLSQEEKKELEDQEKLKRNQDILNGIFNNNPQVSANQESSGSALNNILLFVIVALLLIGTLIWAFMGGKKKPAPPPNLVVIPKNRKAKNLPPSNPSTL